MLIHFAGKGGGGFKACKIIPSMCLSDTTFWAWCIYFLATEIFAEFTTFQWKIFRLRSHRINSEGKNVNRKILCFKKFPLIHQWLFLLLYLLRLYDASFMLSLGKFIIGLLSQRLKKTADKSCKVIQKWRYEAEIFRIICIFLTF